MRTRLVRLVAWLYFPLAAFAPSDYDGHVVFATTASRTARGTTAAAMLSTPANWIWSTRGLPFRNGGVGLVSQRAGPEFSLLAVVAGCRFLHSSPADRLERSDNHLPAGDCVAYTCGSRRPLQPRLGQPVGYSGTLSPGLGPNQARGPLREWKHLLQRQTRR